MFLKRKNRNLYQTNPNPQELIDQIYSDLARFFVIERKTRKKVVEHLSNRDLLRPIGAPVIVQRKEQKNADKTSS